MPLDEKQLKADAERLQKARVTTSGRIGPLGTSAAVRAALPAIRNLRQKGVAWSVIAQALAQQGVVQGKDRIPITERRLTGLVNQIEAQESRRRQAQAQPRLDTTASPGSEQLALGLSSDKPAQEEPAVKHKPEAEHELRAAAFAKLQHSLFKKD